MAQAFGILFAACEDDAGGASAARAAVDYAAAAFFTAGTSEIVFRICEAIW